jgi:hypothetical protein
MLADLYWDRFRWFVLGFSAATLLSKLPQLWMRL